VARVAAVAVVLGGLYTLGALLPFWYLTSPAAGSAFFPPAGLTVATLLLTSRRTWPVWLGVIAVAEMAVDLTHGQSVGMAIGFAAANVIEPLVGALALIWVARRLRRSVRRLLLSYVVCAVGIGPVAGALIGATTAVVVGGASGWFSIAGKWWLGDALGVLAVATPLLAWFRGWDDTHCSVGEALGIAAVATLITLIPAVLWQHPMLYAVLPVLIWGAIRGGVRAVSLAGAAAAFAADWAAVTGRASELVRGGSSAQQLVFVQLWLAVTLLAALTFAVEVSERRRAETAGRKAEADRARAELAVVSAADLERRRIAQETHDIVGHALNVMLLQAGAARRALPGDAGDARVLLSSLEGVGRDAFRDLDVALGLSDEVPDATANTGLSSVPSLVDVMCASGMSVELVLEGERNGLSTLVDWSAYRIVQEAMTNVAKYAPRARTTVTIRYKSDAVCISVVDDGAGVALRAAPKVGAGRGIVGMRERVAVLGGEIEVGPRDGPGFAVRVRLPLPASP